MNQEVPQPATATRSPGAGSDPATSAASRAACRQQAGCEATSCAVRLPAVMSSCVTDGSPLLGPGQPGGGYRTDEMALSQEEDAQHRDQAHHVGRHQQGPLGLVRALEGGQAE